MVLAAGPVRSESPTSDSGAKRPKDTPVLSLMLGLERGHDDNILQLTPLNLDRLEERPGPPRYLIETPDDVTTSLHGSLIWRTRPFQRRETRLELGLSINDYRRNGVKNWNRLSMALTQELAASRRHQTRLDLYGHYTPNYYLGEITDADDSFAAGQRIRRSLEYAEGEIGLLLRQEIVRGRLDIDLGWRRLHRDYDSHFDERDNDNDQWQIQLNGRPLRDRGLRIGILYQFGRLDARGDLASSPIVDSDISYDHHALGGSLMIPWGRGPTNGRMEISWLPQTRTYTTSNPYDVSRYQRVNHRQQVSLQVVQRVMGPFELLARYNPLTSDATFPEGVDISSGATDFDQTRYGVMLRGRWDLLRR